MTLERADLGTTGITQPLPRATSITDMETQMQRGLNANRVYYQSWVAAGATGIAGNGMHPTGTVGSRTSTNFGTPEGADITKNRRLLISIRTGSGSNDPWNQDSWEPFTANATPGGMTKNDPTFSSGSTPAITGATGTSTLSGSNYTVTLVFSYSAAHGYAAGDSILVAGFTANIFNETCWVIGSKTTTTWTVVFTQSANPGASFSASVIGTTTRQNGTGKSVVDGNRDTEIQQFADDIAVYALCGGWVDATMDHEPFLWATPNTDEKNAGNTMLNPGNYTKGRGQDYVASFKHFISTIRTRWQTNPQTNAGKTFDYRTSKRIRFCPVYQDGMLRNSGALCFWRTDIADETTSLRGFIDYVAQDLYCSSNSGGFEIGPGSGGCTFSQMFNGLKNDNTSNGQSFHNFVLTVWRMPYGFWELGAQSTDSRGGTPNPTAQGAWIDGIVSTLTAAAAADPWNCIVANYFYVNDVNLAVDWPFDVHTPDAAGQAWFNLANNPFFWGSGGAIGAPIDVNPPSSLSAGFGVPI